MNSPLMATASVVLGKTIKNNRLCPCTLCRDRPPVRWTLRVTQNALPLREEQNDAAYYDNGSREERQQSKQEEQVVEADQGNDYYQHIEGRCSPLLSHQQSHHRYQHDQGEPGVHIYASHTGEEIQENPYQVQDR